MGLPDFHIEIVKQGWLEPGEDYDPIAADLCTHGDIRLVIGGETIAPGDGHGEYGISEAALGLLRTMTAARTRSPVRTPEYSGLSVEEAQRFERLVPHGCGAILMMGCPIGIDWTVAHVDGRVRISDVIRCDDVGATTVQSYADLAVEVPLEEYQRDIVAFARRAKEPFDGVTKTFFDDFDRETFVQFWEEYDRLLAAATSDGMSA